MTTYEDLQKQLADAEVENHELHETLHNAEATDQDNREIIETLRGLLADRNHLFEDLRNHVINGCGMDYVCKIINEWELLNNPEDILSIP